jgi:surface polysaccharide O-acyltransferase-like enzyme
MESKKRKLYLDVLRCTACVGVIAIHVAGQQWREISADSLNFQALNVFYSVSVFCVPFFVMISGALFLDSSKNVPVRVLFQKYIFRIVVAILIFGAFTYLARFLPQAIKERDFSIISHVKYYIQGTLYYHLWYLYMIIGIYLLMPVIKIFTDNATRRQLEYCMLLLFAFSVIIPTLNKLHLIEILKSWTSYIQFPVVSVYLLYFLAGHYIEKYGIKYKTALYFAGILSLLVTIAGEGYFSVVKDKTFWDFYAYASPNCFFSALAFYVFIKNCFLHKTEINKTIALISKYSLGIYGVHICFILLFNGLGITTTLISSVIMTPLIIVSVLFLSLFTVYLLCKIPFFKKFIL